MKPKQPSLTKAHKPIETGAEIIAKAPKVKWGIIVVGLLISLSVWQLLRSQEIHSFATIVSRNAELLESHLHSSLKFYFQGLERIAKRWETAEGTPQRLWETDVIEYMKHHPEYQAIVWVDPAYRVRWMVPFQDNKSISKLNHSMEKMHKRALNLSRDEKNPIASKTIDLDQEKKGFLYTIPLWFNGELDGFILAVFEFRELLDAIVSHITNSYSIVVQSGLVEIYQRRVKDEVADNQLFRTIEIAITEDVKWTFILKPSQEYIDTQRTILNHFILFVGIILTFFLERMRVFRKRALFSAMNLEMSNLELRKHVEELELSSSQLERHKTELRQQRRAALNIASDAKQSQKAAESARREAQEHSAVLQAVVESSPTGLLGVDSAGNIRFVNDTLVEMFGYSGEDLLGKPVEVLVPESLHHKHREDLRAYLASPDARPMGEGRDLQGRRKDSTTFPVEIGLRPVIGGIELAALAAVTNITERKRITDELHFRNEEMEQLLYTVSHDLKSPLVTIQGFSGMINEALKRNDIADATDSATRVSKATKSMESLINDLLEISRVGRHQETFEPVDVQTLIEQVKNDLASQFSACEAMLLVKSSLPILHTSPKRLRQIFQNLIGNALEYGCELPGDTVSVGYEASLSHDKFWVRDTGPGIPKEHQEKVFLLFQRLKSKKEGTGLGLAIVMKAARLLGGEAWVESEPGQGATFWFSIAKKRYNDQ